MYKNSVIYVGVDVHKDTNSVCILNEFSDAAMKEALTRLLSLFAQKVSENFSIPLDSIMAMVDEFIEALPHDIKHCLIEEKKTA